MIKEFEDVCGQGFASLVSRAWASNATFRANDIQEKSMASAKLAQESYGGSIYLTDVVIPGYVGVRHYHAVTPDGIVIDPVRNKYPMDASFGEAHEVDYVGADTKLVNDLREAMVYKQSHP